MVEKGNELVKWQRECLEFIEDESCVILSSPTGSGKTRCYENWALSKRERPIFITSPIKALSNQRFRDLTAKGYKVGLETGDVHYVPYDDCDIICCTQEIYDNKYREYTNSTLIIDEFSYIFDDKERSRVYIDSLRYSKATNIMICSATFGNPEEVLEYVDRVTGRKFCLYENDERLTELEYKGQISIDDIRNSLVVAYSKDDCYFMALQLYKHRINKVYNMIRGNKNYDPRKRYRSEILEIAKKYNVDNNELIELSTMGVVYYCGRLFPKEKLFVEELFERRLIDTVVGTDALALGVNFPIEKVVFARLNKGIKGMGNRISKNLFEQLSGRAGRKKYYDKGYVFYCNDFGRKKLGNLFESLVRAKNEDFTISLSANIDDILLGITTVEEEARFIVNYSTVSKNYEEVVSEIQAIIDFITKLDLVSYYFKRRYQLDISNGFYKAIANFSENRQRNLELLSEKIFMIQSDFEQGIGRVYMRDYLPKQNCDLFIDVLLEIPLERLISGYCNGSDGIEIRKLLMLRKYLRRLPEKYARIYDLNEIDKIINTMDFTILHPHKYVSSFVDNKNKGKFKYVPSTKSIECPSYFNLVIINGKKYIKIWMERDKILLCDYSEDGSLNLHYVPLNTVYITDSKIVTYEELSNMWSRVNFDSFDDKLDGIDWSKSVKSFFGYYRSKGSR